MSVERLAGWAGLPYPVVRNDVDWSPVQRRIRAPLPPDYRELVENLGGGSFDTHVWIHAPRSDGGPYDLAPGVEEREEALQMLWDAGEDVPAWFDGATDRLLAWASTGNGDFLYWWVEGGGSDAASWPVALQTRDGEWEVFRMPCSEMLYAWVTGTLETDLLSRTFSRMEHTYTPFGGAALH